MSCIASYTGIPSVVRLMPGQYATYTVSVTMPSIPGCNCGSAINTISASVGTGFVVTLANLPALPLSGYCGTPFTLDLTIQALPSTPVGMSATVIIEFDHGSVPLQYAYIGVTTVDVVRERVISLGDVCRGQDIRIPICNPGDVEDIFTLSSCSCNDFVSGDTAVHLLELDSCECGDFVMTFSPESSDTEDSGSCTITVTTGTGYMERIQLVYEIVLCDLSIDPSWTLTDNNNLLPIDGFTFNPTCDVYRMGAIAERKIISLPYVLPNQLQTGDKITIASWQFAQNPQWEFFFPGIPSAGWQYIVCDGSSADGTYDMNWYGQQVSNSNGTVQLVISGGGTIITFIHTFNLLSDSIFEPSGNVSENRDWLLSSDINAFPDLTNTSDNSIYRATKYMSWAVVIQRESGTYQRSFFNIKGQLEWYGENDISPAVVISNITTDIATGTTQATDYFSTARQSIVRIEFDYVSSDIAGAPPDDVWMALFRTDKRNNAVSPQDNYELNYADLTNSVNDGLINVLTPVTYTGSGDRFYCEVEISNVPAGASATDTSPAQYRFALISHHVTDLCVRSNISREILSLNYDDSDFTFAGLEATLNMADRKYATQSLIVPVNSQVESEINIPVYSLDTEIVNKSGGVLSNAMETLRRVALSIYYNSGTTRVQLMNPFQVRRNGIWIDESARRGQPSLVNRSTDSNIHFVFPFTVPDNVLQEANRSNYLNADGTFRTNLQEIFDCQPGITQALPNIQIPNQPASPNLNGIIYIPELNQVWTCDSGNDLIVCVDAETNEILPAIPVTPGDTPTSLLQIGSKVFVSCGLSSACRVINIYTKNITNVSGITGVGLSRLAVTDSGRLFITCPTSGEIIEVNPVTQAQVGSPISTGTLPTDIVFNRANNSIYVGDLSTGDVYVINVSSLTITATIPVGGNVFRMAVTPDSVVLTYSATIVEIDNATLTPTPHTVSTGALGDLKYHDGLIYLLCNADNNLCLIDPESFLQVAEYPSDVAPRDLVIYDGKIYVTNATSDSITPYITGCVHGENVPNYSVAIRDLYLEWKFTFEILGNEENYIYRQVLPRVKPVDTTPVDLIIEEYTEDGATEIIQWPCPSTGKIKMSIDFNANKTFLGVSVEAQPTRNGRLTEKSVISDTIIPVESEYISNVTTTSQTISFDFDFPQWLANGPERAEGELYQDYEFNIHVFAK